MWMLRQRGRLRKLGHHIGVEYGEYRRHHWPSVDVHRTGLLYFWKGLSQKQSYVLAMDVTRVLSERFANDK